MFENHFLTSSFSPTVLWFVSLWPAFQQEHVLILSVSNLILRFIVGSPSRSCSKAFPPFLVKSTCTVALLVAWITSICSSNQRQLLHVKGVWTTEQSIRTDLRLNAKGSAFSARPVEHVQTDLLNYKMVQWFKASFLLSFSLFPFQKWNRIEDSQGTILATSVAFH